MLKNDTLRKGMSLIGSYGNDQVVTDLSLCTFKHKGPVPLTPELGVILITVTFANQFGANLGFRIQLSRKTCKT